MKIGIYDPYLSVLGGGERFIATIAEALEKKNQIDLFTSDDSINQKILERFNTNLNRISIVSDKLFRQTGPLTKLSTLNKYDLFFYVTDGSLFLSTAQKNFLVIQSPAHLPEKKLVNKLKLWNWKIICYSTFIAKIIRKNLGLESLILPPAIENIKIQNVPKENIILNVGRFFLFPHNKKQDVLIEVFKKNHSTLFKNYKLILAGGLTESSGHDYLNNLKKKAAGFPIDFYINAGFTKLLDLYSKSKIYWHAAGFGENLERYPQKAEHFGITTLEAMSAGCVPIVFAAGGQIEIVKDSENGYLWRTKKELVDKTDALIKDDKLRQKLSLSAQTESQKYSKDKFYERLKKIIS